MDQKDERDLNSHQNATAFFRGLFIRIYSDKQLQTYVEVLFNMNPQKIVVTFGEKQSHVHHFGPSFIETFKTLQGRAKPFSRGGRKN